jgi:hypothetical protein
MIGPGPRARDSQKVLRTFCDYKRRFLGPTLLTLVSLAFET